MDWEAESRKRKREVLLLGLEDGYGLNMVVPRELDAEKCAPAAVKLRFRFPDVTGAIKVDFLFLRCMCWILFFSGDCFIWWVLIDLESVGLPPKLTELVSFLSRNDQDIIFL
ncbi:hypothetical protein B296_00047499 [Ensete ventricosum]|uniref:Uncharacterized protein n=1 Tax=Ensete ventricosum TaxID=4639 RepID=A0A426XMP6_ENSVE|nr:hypothetical protein B296_00047499 [Ensete ventricosum]